VKPYLQWTSGQNDRPALGNAAKQESEPCWKKIVCVCEFQSEEICGSENKKIEKATRPSIDVKIIIKHL
jgi:hypothetical protein